MEATQVCPECKATVTDEQTCQEHFHQMLFWEFEHPSYGAEVHHLMVLCYHLQHPKLYSPAGLQYAIQLLQKFVEQDVTPQGVRQENREVVNSNKRTWKITATPTSYGVYAHPVQWRMTAADVVAGGEDNYCESVRTWARLMNEDLKASGNQP
ncbi:DUF5946 family protein [Dictyobacter kobayashii]|uniref:Uncharacterized protein n=1 Tax=Dictyobacter kobayashii TaxID=2014872 RepID=A0A402AR63_9CHLR|nr:DUF5946 family protein [Dictyobacter kobayashii]GCE21585.1 hypothetical protein KDK_53850 [Dictyobacter kobayashii]